MDYNKMTIESLAEYCHNRSGYAINKADLMCRIEHLCRNYKDEQKQANEDYSPKKYGIFQSVSNWRYIVLASFIGTVVGSVVTAVVFACC